MGTVGQTLQEKVKKISFVVAAATLLTPLIGLTARAQSLESASQDDLLSNVSSSTKVSGSSASGDRFVTIAPLSLPSEFTTPTSTDLAAFDTAASTPTPSAAPASDGALPDAPLPQARIKGYQRPSEHVKLVNYLFDAYGPFPIVGGAAIAAVNQAEGTPHEWGGGIGGFGRRWGSNYGIGAITTTTRYGMAEILHEDTLYYRCECTGFLPRLGHALISTFTGRRGEDGHRVFSVPSLVAPYVGEMVAVYAWYPGRYDARDAFRQANYSLLVFAAGNVSLEFLPTGPHSLLGKMHLQNRHAAPENSN